MLNLIDFTVLVIVHVLVTSHVLRAQTQALRELLPRLWASSRCFSEASRFRQLRQSLSVNVFRSNVCFVLEPATLWTVSRCRILPIPTLLANSFARRRVSMEPD